MNLLRNILIINGLNVFLFWFFLLKSLIFLQVLVLKNRLNVFLFWFFLLKSLIILQVLALKSLLELILRLLLLLWRYEGLDWRNFSYLNSLLVDLVKLRKGEKLLLLLSLLLLLGFSDLFDLFGNKLLGGYCLLLK